MKIARIFFFLLFISQMFTAWGLPPELSVKDLNSPPPRIIRVCCAFGADLQLVGVPFMKINHITGIDKIGSHHYMGDNREGNGIIYTRNGGFIDIGHLRDQADWTAYLYSLIINHRDKGELVKQLGYEGGSKTLTINVNNEVDSSDCLLVAGKIAFDLSLWHELSTWFGASAVPMMPERYSSFSVEDVYSNLLGVLIGIEAVKSDLPYEKAMTEILSSTLYSLGCVKGLDDTYAALDDVKNIWWTNDKRLPNKKVLIERDTDVFLHCRPWLISGRIEGNVVPMVLDVPLTTEDGQLLTSFYKLSINLNYKFPLKEIFPERETRIITQDDFHTLLGRVSNELYNKEHTSFSHKGVTHQTEAVKNRF